MPYLESIAEQMVNNNHRALQALADSDKKTYQQCVELDKQLKAQLEQAKKDAKMTIECN